MLLLTALKRMILVSKQDRVVRVDAVILFFTALFATTCIINLTGFEGRKIGVV